MFSGIRNKSPQQTTPSEDSASKQVIQESIDTFHAILRDEDQLLNAFWTRGSLEESGRVFPLTGDGTTIAKVRLALEAIDCGDTTIYSRHDETRESVIVGAAEFARFREHMKTSDALIYEAAAFTAVTICVYERQSSADSADIDLEKAICAQKDLQEKVLQALQIEILGLEYARHIRETTLLINDPATPESMTARVFELINEDWEIKKTKSIDELHQEMILIKAESDNIQQMMQASKIAYEEAKEALRALLQVENMSPELMTLCNDAIKLASECEERQNMSLAYDPLRKMLLECMDKVYSKLIESSLSILNCYDIPEESAQPLRDEISKKDTRVTLEKLEALIGLFNAADSAKIDRQMKVESSSKANGRYDACEPAKTAVLIPSSFVDDFGSGRQTLFNQRTQKQYKNKQLALGIGLVFLGVALLSITIMSAIATFGASVPLASLALPLSMSLAASGIAIMGMAGFGLAAAGGHSLSL